MNMGRAASGAKRRVCMASPFSGESQDYLKNLKNLKTRRTHINRHFFTLKPLAALALALALILSLAACGGKQGDASGSSEPVDLTAFYETLTQNENAPALMPLEEAELMDALYPGLSEIETSQRIVATAAITSVAAELALVEVANAEDVPAVEAIFQARIDYQVGDDANPGGAWYPETIENWKQNARIVSNGSCVMLAVWENADDVAEQFNALFA